MGLAVDASFCVRCVVDILLTTIAIAIAIAIAIGDLLPFVLNPAALGP